MKKSAINLMNLAPRCAATSKRSGFQCSAPAIRGCRVCRFHGAGGGAPKGKRNGNYSHGFFTAEAVAERRALADLIADARKFMKLID